jgi:beta-phosphoglucomutase family hydrolase
VNPTPTIDCEKFDAVLFDLDGVLTDTASIHSACWKETFDAYLRERSRRTGEPFVEFDIDGDYHEYVDGKPRYDGVRDFLASRGITLPEGNPESPPDEESVCGVGNRKRDLVKTTMDRDGISPYPGSVSFVKQVKAKGLQTAVVTSSASSLQVLSLAGITDLFDTCVDAEVAIALKLRGKPAPDTFLEAARMLGAPPGRAIVVEDAISGVQAGRAGDFGLVIGVARKDNAESLMKNGADIAVADLQELLE